MRWVRMAVIDAVDTRLIDHYLLLYWLIELNVLVLSNVSLT
jgi:hypothetical protein